MNLDKLFNMQAKLDDHIKKEKGLEGKELLDEKILALQVELGELANEWRGFKFWSEDQESRTDYICELCEGSEEISVQTAVGNPEHGYDVYDVDVNCPLCEDVDFNKNPLLEEYVDGLHFLLSIGNDLETTYKEKSIMDYEKWNTTQLFNAMYYQLAMFENEVHSKAPRTSQTNAYRLTFNVFLSIGKRLGFTWEQIEQAYFDKNAINHKRQESGY